MQPAAAAAPLPPRAGEALFNAISGMTAETWADPAQLEDTLRRSEGLLCALHAGCAGLGAYVQLLTGGAGHGGPCTFVWTAGTIAYRCRTCGLSPSAAVCVDCFRASDHEGHDYVMYTSDAGGCCDCGDMSSWRPQGCCPRHRPPGEGHGAAEEAQLPPADDVVARGVVGCALAALQLALEGSIAVDPPAGYPSREHRKAAALRIIRWLVQLGQAPALRGVICQELQLSARPAAAISAAAALVATPGLPREAAAVARMLQQQREVLLGSLGTVLPLPGGQDAVYEARRPLPVLGSQLERYSLLYWELSTLLLLDPTLVEELATLQILLLYSTPFKEVFGEMLLAFYPHIGALGKRHAVTKALDRLTVQVFHLEETTLALNQKADLLKVLLTSLLDALRRGLGDTGRLEGDSPVMTGRLYLRIAADLHMCLSHPAVVLALLAGPQSPLFDTHFLEVLRLIEGASPFRRKLGDHVLYESEAWINIVQVEVHMMHMLVQGMMHTLLKAAEAGTVPPATAGAALVFGLQMALAAVAAAAGPMQVAEEPHTFWPSVLQGQSTISAHIPLERLAATFLAGLLHLTHTSGNAEPYVAALYDAVGGTKVLLEAEAAAHRWQMCGLAAERITAWMSQIRQRLWVRNGQQLLRLEAFYNSPYWSDHGLDCDLLSMQAWLSTTPNLSRSLGFLTVDSGAVHLLKASACPTLAEAARLLQVAHESQELLRCAADWLRLLVVLLRERSVWHPTYSPLLLRRAIVHILAAGSRSHSEVGDELPYELAHSAHFDQVLGEVADYMPPTAAATGRYSLKRACWREFDPFYPHYTRRDLQSAMHLAQEGGTWQPEWQLQQGLPPLPRPMVGLQRMLHHLLRIVWAALLLACMDGSAAGGGSSGGSSGGAAEDSALAATNLLCMAVQRKRADLAAMLAGEAAAPGAPPLPESWRSPLRFRAKCEEHLAGAPQARPGILYLLRVLAGAERWVDGSRREASWELQRCAAAAAAETAALLAEARQAAPEWQAPVDQLAGEVAATQGEPGAEGGQAPAAAQPAAGGVAAAADSGGDQASPAADTAAFKKEAAKARQQQMLARMRAQQAKAAAALLEESSEEEAEGEAAAEGATAMAVDASGEVSAAGAAAMQQAAPPAHHPAAWEAHPGECALCKSGSDTAPLGYVAQLQVTLLPTMAAADPATPLTPEHPGACGGALGAAPGAAAERWEGEDAPPSFPLGGAGPRVSLFDRQPSLHLLCCGHMLHASCLDSYRASWRHRIAQGQFVEGFQLLQASPVAGEYLCPICRRLGNCLLPAAAPPQSSDSPPQAEQQPTAPLGSAEALEQLRQLLQPGPVNWAAAPATTSGELQQQWQEVQAAGGAGPGIDVSLQLVPRFGSQAAGVVALAQDARAAASKWLSQQHRALEWLQLRAAERLPSEPLWGIPVEAAPQAPSPGRAQPAQTLQAALQQLLENAAAGAGPQGADFEAIGAIAEVAAAVAEEMEDEQEGSSDEEGVAAPAEVAAGGGGVPALFQQLEQQALARADDMAGQQPPQPPPVAAAAPERVMNQHTQRLWRLSPPAAAGSLLWSLLGSGLVQWEVAHRDPACAPSAEVSAAHWRALQSLVQLAAAASLPAYLHCAALQALQQLAEGSLQSVPEAVASALDVPAALVPGLQQLQVAPSASGYQPDQDPFALLLSLLPALLSRPDGVAAEGGLTCSSHRSPPAVLRALLALLHPVAAGQAVALATNSSRPVGEAAAAAASSPPLASALEGAAASQLLPWLQRARLLSALLSGSAAPPAPDVSGGSAGPASAALAASLGLPPLQVVLRSPAAGALAPPAGTPAWQLPSTMQLSVHAAQHRWAVAVPPLPPAPKLLQLPASYQGWYLALGSRTCSVCGSAPSEPALCLRCGAVVCCNGRRCMGPARQGMCYTHSLVCGGGTCCFFLVKNTRLLVIRKNRVTFLASPYVDSHGEEDPRLQRGKPLSLHTERLRHLVQLWRSSALDYDSHVLHTANHRNEPASVY